MRRWILLKLQLLKSHHGKFPAHGASGDLCSFPGLRHWRPVEGKADGGGEESGKKSVRNGVTGSPSLE